MRGFEAMMDLSQASKNLMAVWGGVGGPGDIYADPQ